MILKPALPDDCRSAMVLVAFVVDTAFALCLMGFLGMHARLLAANCTTIEMFEKRRMPNWPYDHGFVANFHEVFGRRYSFAYRFRRRACVFYWHGIIELQSICCMGH